ncbi:MAG: DnaJ domain-containing protein [Nitrospinota bacterium]|nr:DnaJ domain-containing protein [Nitrospinota bacterium]
MARRPKEFKDYYAILKVPPDCSSQEEIKKSFRKLALDLHPDHNPDDPEREERFKEVTEAYGVLSDPLKKNEYDRFRADYLAGRTTSSSDFHYSQEDIFAGMFRGKNTQEIFEELNREFNRSGFRSGNTFFQSLFFGGAVGGLGKILRMVPGPIGKIGIGLKLAQVVGSSLYAMHKMNQQKQTQSGQNVSQKSKNPLINGMKGIFGKKQVSLDLDFYISIPPVEALNGTRKKISYQVNGKTEQLMVRIPPKFLSGGKLRIKDKGKIDAKKRGDLILSVHVDPKASPSK